MRSECIGSDASAAFEAQGRTTIIELAVKFFQTYPEDDIPQWATNGIVSTDRQWLSRAPGWDLPSIASRRIAWQAAGAAARNSMSIWRPNKSESAFGASSGCKVDLRRQSTTRRSI